MAKTSTLDAIAPETITVHTDIGAIEIKPFTLGQIRKCSPVITELMRAINFTSIQTMKESFEVNVDELAFSIFGDEMHRPMLLLAASTGKSFEELDKLPSEQAIDLLEATIQICVVPVAQTLGKRLEKLAPDPKAKKETGQK